MPELAPVTTATLLLSCCIIHPFQKITSGSHGKPTRAIRKLRCNLKRRERIGVSAMAAAARGPDRRHTFPERKNGAQTQMGRERLPPPRVLQRTNPGDSGRCGLQNRIILPKIRTPSNKKANKSKITTRTSVKYKEIYFDVASSCDIEVEFSHSIFKLYNNAHLRSARPERQTLLYGCKRL